MEERENKLDFKINLLRTTVRDLGSTVVAFSGGVDSSLVLKICNDELDDVLAITAASPSYPAYELEKAKEIVGHIGAKHLVVYGKEIDDDNYRKNTMQRCYFCKSNLYKQLEEVARERGYKTIVNGVNYDDLFDFRPGMKAADEFAVRSPLKEAGLGKTEIVELALQLGLPNWNKPASPCLSSRVPYGIAITPEILEKIERAENVLRAVGISQFRVRYHKEIARIEVGKEEFVKMIENAEEIVQKIKQAGFSYVTLDLAGFKSGNLNIGISHEEKILSRSRV